MENIETIREKAIAEIKEKVKKNIGYLHPCNKERQEDMKKLEFANGYEFTCWMQQNGIMRNPTHIENDAHKNMIKNSGFKDDAERIREWRHRTGRSLPKEFNENCASWLGYIGENYVSRTFEDPVIMPPNNPGFDWKCKRGDKIDSKARCLDYNTNRWSYGTRYNNVAGWFIMSAWDSRDSLTPLHVWAFYKNDIVRGRKFWRRENISIVNTQKGLKEFEKYEVTNRLHKLKELCNRSR